MDDGSAGAGMQQAVQPEAAVPRKGPWTAEEDHVLVNYVAAHGEGSWNRLARAAGLNRTGKSCRLRWLNYLRPDVRRGNLTAEEQQLIVSLQARWGNKWSRIAKHLPGRTDNEVKNFWRTRIQVKNKHTNKDDDVGASAIQSIVMEAAGMYSSSSGSSIGTGGVTHGYSYYGVVAHQYQPKQPSRCSADDLVEHHLGGHQAAHGGAAGGTAATDCFLPELLAASGESFWALDDFWSTKSQPYHGNNS
ncbi:hypothetical protein BS78_09G240300 [Paspalum vaginatum]|nr:hypothetical protein BS78_09G240300 [Paspalum vaginatum]